MRNEILSLDLKRPIQVRTGDYRRQWMDAKIVYVSMEDVGQDEDGKAIQGLSFSVDFGDGLAQRVTDAFGWSSEEWRYKEKCCEQCKWCSKEGGDIVPYGSTTATLPEGYVCDCPYMPEEIEVPNDETNEGRECRYHEFVTQMEKMEEC